MTSRPPSAGAPASKSRVSLPALVAVVVYVVIAAGAHHAWPFYVFDMYAFAAPGTSSRISLVDQAGRTRDVRDVAALRCPPTAQATLDGPACAAWWTVVARDDEVWETLRTRPLTGPGEPATLVRRGWRWGAAANADDLRGDAQANPTPPTALGEAEGGRARTTGATPGAPVATDCAAVRCQVRW